MSREVSEGPRERIVGRLRELADAVTQGRAAVAREFTMSVPAEPERDADLVLSSAADLIERQAVEVEALRADNEALRSAIGRTLARLAVDPNTVNALFEAERLLRAALGARS